MHFGSSGRKFTKNKALLNSTAWIHRKRQEFKRKSPFHCGKNEFNTMPIETNQFSGLLSRQTKRTLSWVSLNLKTQSSFVLPKPRRSSQSTVSVSVRELNRSLVSGKNLKKWLDVKRNSFSNRIVQRWKGESSALSSCLELVQRWHEWIFPMQSCR